VQILDICQALRAPQGFFFSSSFDRSLQNDDSASLQAPGYDKMSHSIIFAKSLFAVLAPVPRLSLRTKGKAISISSLGINAAIGG
jgi:hypothetical protein